MQCSLRTPGSRSRLLTIILSVVALVCLLLTGSAQLQAQDKVPENRDPFRLDLVPEKALGVIAFRPAQLLSASMNKPIRELALKEYQTNADFGVLGINPTDVTSITLIYMPLQAGETGNLPIKFAVVVKSTQKLDRQQIQKKFTKIELKETTHKGITFLTQDATDGDSLLFLDEHVFVLSDKASAIKQIIVQMNDRKNSVWQERLQPVVSASVAGGVNMETARSLVGGPLIQQLAQRIPIWPMLSPLWERTDIAALGITVDKSLTLELIFDQEQHSQEIKQSLSGLLEMGKNMLQSFKAAAEQRDRPLPPPLNLQFKLIEEALSSAQVTQDKKQVRFSLSLNDETCAQLIALTVPAVMQARAAARRSVAKNNIKQIMLALHNYHDRYGHFPPAVVTGPDGKTPHSWRVELLPYLDQQALYDQYRMNEPWDSEHNRKIAETAVPVFQNPGSKKPANSAYFAVVGDGTAFGNKQGVSFKDITDGTSNTIAIVEADRDIPWTKPEDITYDGEKLPKFGGFHQGGYNVGICDGSVKFISEQINKETLKFLLLIADGEVLN